MRGRQTVPATTQRPYQYVAFGLRIESEIELPELHAAEHPDSAPDLTITYGAAGVAAVGARRFNGLYAVSPGDSLIEVAGVARYRVLGGRHVVVEPAPGAAERRVRLNLLGTAVGLACLQRGELILHGSAVEVDGQAMIFAGPSGAGKSTTAAALEARGARLLCDDICAVDFSLPVPGLWPGIRRLKLWDDSAHVLGRPPRTDPLPISEKLQYPAPDQMQMARPIKLRSVVVIEAAPPGHAAELAMLDGVNALDALLANTYRPTLMLAQGLGADNLDKCARLVGSVRIARLRRSSDLADLGLTMELIRNFAAT